MILTPEVQFRGMCINSSGLSISLIVLIFLVVAGTAAGCSPASEKPLPVIGSPDSPRLGQVIAGLKAGLSGMALVVAQVPELGPEVDEAVRRRRTEPPRLFLALGTPALMALARVEKRVPVVFAMVANPYFSGAAYDPGDPAWHQQNITGIASPPPVAAALEHGSRLSGPGPWGLLYDPLDGTAVEVAAQFVREAQKLGVTPLVEASREAADDESGLKKLVQRGARVMYLPPTATAGRYAAMLLGWGRQGKVLVVSGHPEIPPQGAILRVCLDYERLGEEAAALARRVLGGESSARIPIMEKTPLKVEVDEHRLERWSGYPPRSRLGGGGQGPKLPAVSPQPPPPTL